MTLVQRRERLIEWEKTIYKEVQQILVNEHIFWEFGKVVDDNPEFKSSSNLFTNWIANGYVPSAVIAVRRQLKAKDSVSARAFLEEVKQFPDIVSRQDYVNLANGKELFLRELLQSDYDKIAGAGMNTIPNVVLQAQIDKLVTASSAIEQYADRRVAHYDRRGLASPFPTFNELSQAIQMLEELTKLYHRLLTGAHVSSLLPTFVFDWHEVFKFAWEPNKH
jgi:hypothetical protein